MLHTKAIVLVLSAAILSMQLTACAPRLGADDKGGKREEAVISGNVHTGEDEVVKLGFEPVNIENSISLVGNNEIEQVISRKIVHGKYILIFKRTGDDEFLHGGLEMDSKVYDLGEISMMFDKDAAMQNISFEYINLYGKDFIRFRGIMGANYAPTSYFKIKDGGPELSLRAEGYTTEVDLDKDGEIEIVASFGTLARTYIYKYKEDHFLGADLNKALSLEVVYLSDRYVSYFEGYKKNIEDPIYYRFMKDTLINAAKELAPPVSREKFIEAVEALNSALPEEQRQRQCKQHSSPYSIRG